MLVTFESKKPSKPPAASASTGSTTTSNLTSANHTPATDNDVDDTPIIHNLDSNHPPDSKIFHFTMKKFKGGCITCKIRKKRCTEERPICSDCKRLGKNCVWASEDMSTDTVRELKRKVEEEENNAKKKKLEKPDLKKSKVDKLLSTTRDASRPSVKQHKSFVPLEHFNLQSTHQTQSHRQPSVGPPLDDVQDDDDDDDASPLDTEAPFPRQTPVSTNLLHFPQRGQQHMMLPSALSIPHSVPTPTPTSTSTSTTPHINSHIESIQVPKPNSITAPSPRWDSIDHFAEFNSFFESNLRNNISKYSDKITQLDEQLDDRDTTGTSASQLVSKNSPMNPFMFDTLLPDSPYFEFLNMHVPSPLPNMSLPPELQQDPMGVKLYDYYRNKLAGIISIVPPESNYYTKVFLPMAMVNPGILYSIMAWSGYHMGGEFEKEGSKYMERALDYIHTTPVKTDGEALQRLANLLIMIGAEICKGDVRKWPVFLQWGAKIIKDRGGLYKFNGDKEQHWLISNFAYHDILASSTSERGTYFSVEDYDNFIVNFGFGVDPLQGIVKPLFNIIGEISSLATETKRLLKISSNSLGYGIMNDDEDYGKDHGGRSGNGNHDKNHDNDQDGGEIPGLDTPDSDQGGDTRKYTRYSSLLTIMQKASSLETKINNVKPDPEDLKEFTEEELELQLTLFELFQLTAKLHLRQSVLRLNPSSLETQFILCELLKCLDVVLKSPVESSLCFPLFIAGMNCTTRKDRRMMLERFQDIIERYNFKNLERAKTIMEQVWFIDPSGTRCVDWYEIVKRLGWDISFA